MKNAKMKIVLVIILLAAVTALIAGFIIMNGLPEDFRLPIPGQTEQGTVPAASETGASEPDPTIQTQQLVQTEPVRDYIPVEFPLMLENGMLEIESMFDYTGMNPDDDNTEAKNIAAITLVNRSGEYLAEARITLTLSSGQEAEFVVTDLPAGKRVMAFCIDSTVSSYNCDCKDYRVEASFDPDASIQEDRLAVSVEAMTVTVQNLTGAQIPELVIYCRCPLGEDYFGGITYQYPLNNLPANGTATVEAWDCVLGMAEVVRIEINE